MVKNTQIELCKSIATAAHSGQFRRDGKTPYIVHPKAVVDRVVGDTDAVSAAWLHDVIEDCDETRTSLQEKGVPSNVLDAVEAMTKTKGPSYEEYLARVRGNPLARKVKIADMLANLSDGPTERQIKKYAHGLLFLLEEDDE